VTFTSIAFSAAKELIGRTAHIEKANRCSKTNVEYCKKEGDFYEFGDCPTHQGKRTDLDDGIDWADKYTRENGGRPPDDRAWAKEKPKLYIRYNKTIVNCARLRAPPPVIREGTPNEWQARLEEELRAPANDRTVKFFVDDVGGNGKSWFQGYYVSKYPDDAQCLGVGKRDDIAYAIDPSKIVFFFNVPRGAMEFLQYTIFEQLKDKQVFSSKYQSVTKTLRDYPHVVVFSNEAPDLTKMSEDRYDIITF
jgi:hypothetical protein